MKREGELSANDYKDVLDGRDVFVRGGGREVVLRGEKPLGGAARGPARRFEVDPQAQPYLRARNHEKNTNIYTELITN